MRSITTSICGYRHHHISFFCSEFFWSCDWTDMARQTKHISDHPPLGYHYLVSVCDYYRHSSRDMVQGWTQDRSLDHVVDRIFGNDGDRLASHQNHQGTIDSIFDCCPHDRIVPHHGWSQYDRAHLIEYDLWHPRDSVMIWSRHYPRHYHGNAWCHARVVWSMRNIYMIKDSQNCRLIFCYHRYPLLRYHDRYLLQKACEL